MNIRILLTPVVVAGLFVAGALPVAAGSPQPGGGPAFGQHIASMAPEHPLAGGTMFGQCVSTMASSGECPHVH